MTHWRALLSVWSGSTLQLDFSIPILNFITSKMYYPLVWASLVSLLYEHYVTTFAKATSRIGRINIAQHRPQGRRSAAHTRKQMSGGRRRSARSSSGQRPSGWVECWGFASARYIFTNFESIFMGIVRLPFVSKVNENEFDFIPLVHFWYPYNYGIEFRQTFNVYCKRESPTFVVTN